MSDSSELHALLLAERQAHAATKADLGSQLRAALLERDAAKAKLQALLQRYFGQSSEKLDPRQLQLAWAAVEADLQIHSPPKPPPSPRPPREPSVRRARRMEDLPVLEKIVIEPPIH